MAVEQDFIPFATGGSANVITQSAYAALTSITQNGFQAGIAQSNQLNKVWRQSSIMSAVLAQFIVNQTGQPAIDDGTTATLLANLATAVAVSARQNPVLADTGTANTYVVANLSAFTAYPTASGLVIDVSIANANTGASTINVDGLGAKPIYGLGLQPLQGGELVVKGVANLLYIVASTVNGGNGAFILMECAGGAQQVAPATQSQHAVQLQQNTGVVGSSRNLKASIATAGTSVTFTADEIAIKGAFAGQSQIAANFNQSVSTSNTNAIGGVVGTALAASGFCGIYAAYNPSTGAYGLYGKNGNSLLSNVDTSLTGWIGTLISVWPLNASTQFVVGYQRDRRLSIVAATVLNSSTNTSNVVTSLAVGSAIPLNAVRAFGFMSAQSSAISQTALYLYGSSSSAGQQAVYGGQTTSGNFASNYTVDISTAQTLYYATTSTGGTLAFVIAVSGYDI